MSGFWLFSFKPPLENPRLRPKVLKAPLLYLGPRLGFSRGVINYDCHRNFEQPALQPAVFTYFRRVLTTGNLPAASRKLNIKKMAGSTGVSLQMHTFFSVNPPYSCLILYSM